MNRETTAIVEMAMGSRRAFALLFALLSACGGASFTMGPTDLSRPDGGTSDNWTDDGGSTRIDAGVGDAFADASTPPAKDSGGTTTATDASSSPDGKAPPDGSGSAACTTEGPVTLECGPQATPTATYPGQLCLSVLNTAGGGLEAIPTPAACASWCTFTCACLIDAGVCPGVVTTCQVWPYDNQQPPNPGQPIEIDCTESN